MSLEAPLGDGVVRPELDPHVVVQGGDDLGLLRAAELPVELRVRAQAAAHLHVIVFAHLMANTGQFYLPQGMEKRTCEPRLQPTDFFHSDRPRQGASLSLTYVVSFGLEHVKHQSDAVLGGRHQLPHAVLVGGVLFGPAGGGDGAIQLGDEPTAGSC